MLLAEGLRFPEGPAFDPAGRLWCVELKGGGLVRLDGGTLQRIPTGGEPNGIAVDGLGRICFCDAGERSVRRLDPRDGSTATLAAQRDGAPLGKPNDLCFDARGNLLFTCPNDGRREPTGYLCCLAGDGTLEVVREGFFFCNGLALAGGDLVVAETYRQRLWRGRWDAAARRWLDPQPWGEALPGAPGPDGMALGADGLLWVAVYGAGQVMALDPAGRIVRRLDLPGRKPTNCAFDPAGRFGLVVTEAERGELHAFPELGRGAPLP